MRSYPNHEQLSVTTAQYQYGYHANTADGFGVGSAAVDEPEHTATVPGT